MAFCATSRSFAHVELEANFGVRNFGRVVELALHCGGGAGLRLGPLWPNARAKFLIARQGVNILISRRSGASNKKRFEGGSWLGQFNNFFILYYTLPFYTLRVIATRQKMNTILWSGLLLGEVIAIGKVSLRASFEWNWDHTNVSIKH